MMKTRKMRMKEHVQKVQKRYNQLANSRNNQIKSCIHGLKGKLIQYPFTCDLCGHQYTIGYVYTSEKEKYEICNFCKNKVFNKQPYLKIQYTPMGNKR